MKILTLMVGATLLVASNTSFAKADVDITWENPKKFRDVQPTMQSRAKFRAQTFERLEKYMNKLAEGLPEGQTLAITVTNLDLAGRVWPSSFVGLGSGGSEVRLIKSVDIPRITFSYKLVDSDGTVIQEAEEVKLKDMGFQTRHNPFFKSESLRYEKNMLRRWFNDEFPSLVASN
ncbi:DUF3016 domain-containing protein [Aliiglaciecola sp.]|nr:DUF3016 domain-containing protein [Aliiglaciecola sp.]